MKTLYTFTIDKEQEVEKIEQTDEGTLTKKVKESVPVEILIKKPGQQDINESTTVYASKISEYISRGITPAALLSKKYEEAGGLFTKEEQEERIKAAENFGINGNKYIDLIKKDKRTDEEEQELKEIATETEKYYQVLQDFKKREEDAFANTAEVLARAHVIFWWFLNLAYIKQDNKIVSVFGEDKDFKKQEEKYYSIAESNDPFYQELYNRASVLVTLWHSGEISTPEQFKDMDDKLLSKTAVVTKVKESESED